MQSQSCYLKWKTEKVPLIEPALSNEADRARISINSTIVETSTVETTDRITATPYENSYFQVKNIAQYWSTSQLTPIKRARQKHNHFDPDLHQTEGGHAAWQPCQAASPPSAINQPISNPDWVM